MDKQIIIVTRIFFLTTLVHLDLKFCNTWRHNKKAFNLNDSSFNEQIFVVYREESWAQILKIFESQLHLLLIFMWKSFANKSSGNSRNRSIF